VAYVLWLDACEPELAGRVGGKAVGLGHLLRQSLEVPAGFVITTQAYRDWIIHRSLKQEVARSLEESAGVAAEDRASRRIRAAFEATALLDELAAEVCEAYLALGEGREVSVAVRSSATAEDTADASFAGQQETYLWVTGAPSLLVHVLRCWASLFTPQAISYRRRLAIGVDEVAMGVVVQRMVAAEAAGVMMTIDPVTGDRSQISIEGSFGLGLSVVGGEVTPDRYGVDKVTLDIRSRAVGYKPFEYRLDPAAGEVRRFDLSREEGQLPCLQDDEVIRIAEVGKRAERALGGPQDIEWAVGPGPEGPRQLFMLQTRPETVWSRKSPAPISAPDQTAADRALKLMLGGSSHVRRDSDP
jgi:rifampicin phosphotransferase